MSSIAIELGKRAGWGSEVAGGMLNPLNHLGGNLGGLIAATITPTRSLREQAGHEGDMWKNLLIPGYGEHNYMKRQGAMIRSPEMNALQRQEKTKQETEKPGGGKSKEEEEDASLASIGKAAGWMSEIGGGFNPLNIYGGSIGGAVAAGITPTRSLREQAGHEGDMWKNLLIPGYAQHNQLKRIGSGIRSPEMKALQRQEAGKKKPGSSKKDKEKKEDDALESLGKDAASNSFTQGGPHRQVAKNNVAHPTPTAKNNPKMQLEHKQPSPVIKAAAKLLSGLYVANKQADCKADPGPYGKATRKGERRKKGPTDTGAGTDKTDPMNTGDTATIAGTKTMDAKKAAAAALNVVRQQGGSVLMRKVAVMQFKQACKVARAGR